MSNDPHAPLSQDDGEPSEPAGLQAQPDAIRPMRVWPVFAVYVGAFFVCAAFQIPIAIAIVAFHLIAGNGPPSSADFFQTPWQFVALALPAQLGMLAVWWLAIRYGDPRARGFRAIGRTSLSVASYVCFLLSTIAVLWLGGLLGGVAIRVVGDWESNMFGRLYENMTWLGGARFVLFIALAPALVEELFFRGFMQRRLLARWSPVAAISVVAILFAAFHGTPVWAISVLPLGIWFGILAWRTGSLWPGMLCHGFINGSLNLWRVGAQLKLWPADVSPTVYVAGIGLCVACLLMSAWVLYAYRANVGAATDDG